MFSFIFFSVEIGSFIILEIGFINVACKDSFFSLSFLDFYKFLTKWDWKIQQGWGICDEWLFYLFVEGWFCFEAGGVVYFDYPGFEGAVEEDIKPIWEINFCNIKKGLP